MSNCRSVSLLSFPRVSSLQDPVPTWWPIYLYEIFLSPLIDTFMPIPFYYLARRYPRSHWPYINTPVAMIAAASISPISDINVISWVPVGFFFQFYMRCYHFRWWMRYNYLLSSALDAGVITGRLCLGCVYFHLFPSLLSHRLQFRFFLLTRSICSTSSASHFSIVLLRTISRRW
jgi:OPT oligopeptide transporter protein